MAALESSIPRLPVGSAFSCGDRVTGEELATMVAHPYGQLRRDTDRYPDHRQAQLALAITLITAIKLVDRRNRWNPTN